jgi:hypothetical protein
MKIDCELTDAERSALSFMLGLSTGQALSEFRDPELARNCVRLMNKLFAKSPNYLPYDENSFDPSVAGFPFKTLTPQ